MSKLTHPTAMLALSVALCSNAANGITSNDADRSICGGPAGNGVVYLSFDHTYTLYSTTVTTGTNGENILVRHDVSDSEVSSICAEGYDVRATPDSTAQGSYFPTAVEFYNAALDHYFVTTSEIEIADLDAGVHGGWMRTGQQFDAYVRDPTPATSALPLASVCRYYGLPAFGLDTHFYSALQEECQAVAILWPRRFTLETADAFRAHLPKADGACAIGTRPLFRLYNARADANHRYTTSLAVRDEMIAKGWIPEGYGVLGVGMCVRAD